MENKISGILNTIVDYNIMKKFIKKKDVLSYSSRFTLMFLTYIDHLHLPAYNAAYINILHALCNCDLLTFYSDYNNINNDFEIQYKEDFIFYGMIIFLSEMIKDYKKNNDNENFLYKIIYNSLPNELKTYENKKLIFDGICKTLNEMKIKQILNKTKIYKYKLPHLVLPKTIESSIKHKICKLLRINNSQDIGT